jgi:hypothetical protein
VVGRGAGPVMAVADATSPAPRRMGVAASGRYREHAHPSRGRRVSTGFTDAEYAAIAAAAAQAGLTPTGFVAFAALGIAEHLPQPTTPLSAAGAEPPAPERAGLSVARTEELRARLVGREALAGLQGELADVRLAVVRVGTNLNQAVRVLRATGQAPVYLQHVVEVCGRALAAVDAVASRVHRRL